MTWAGAMMAGKARAVAAAAAATSCEPRHLLWLVPVFFPGSHTLCLQNDVSCTNIGPGCITSWPAQR